MSIPLLQGSTNLEAIQIIKKLGGNLSDSYLEEGNKFTEFYYSNLIILMHRLFVGEEDWSEPAEKNRECTYTDS